MKTFDIAGDYRELLRIPEYISELNQYRRKAVLAHARQIQLKAFNHIEAILAANHDKNDYPKEYLPDRQFDFWAERHSQYAEATRVIEILERSESHVRTASRDRIETLEDACGGADSNKFITIKGFFIQHKLCDSKSFAFLKDKKSLANYLKDMYVKGYTPKLSENDMIAIANNSFNRGFSRKTLTSAKGNPPYMPSLPYYQG